ncbi:putative membrane protein [Escherichia coli 5-366-08_S4_C2]|nr:hypothetical protein [Escherichia coli]ENA26405.1 putative membrane protein [Escherichia coli BCE007_MS-11]ENB29500.1 putative membrane protein [Escherichia coli BCE032_MS-12]END52612.1 putative membrane protein [Escherichia coli BCE006_MS-23]KEL20589.1 putative membrane protein [Escherichia coli 5-366-08_S4_C2]
MPVHLRVKTFSIFITVNNNLLLGDLFLIGCVVLFIVNFWEGGCFYFSEKQFKAAITLSGIAGGWGTIMILCMDR